MSEGAPGTSRRGFLLGAAATACAPRPLRAEDRPWSVLYINTDEHNPHVMGHAGHPVVRTPRLDALAAQALRCEAAYVASPICAPTRQSWLTGLMPQEHGQVGNPFLFDPRNPTLMQVFQAAGYRTLCLGKLHTNAEEVDGAFGFDELLNQTLRSRWQPLAEAYADPGAPKPYVDPADAALLASLPPRAASVFRNRVRPDPGSCFDHVLVEEACARMAALKGGGPFFLYVSLRFPHYPFDLTEAFYHRHDPAALPPPDAPPASRADTPCAAHSAARWGWDQLTEAQRRMLQARYYGAVAYADHLVGRLLDGLAAQGLDDRTLVVYASDHGDMAGEKALWLKSVMFEGAARKPLLFRMPGVLPEGRRFQGLLSEVDILPTTLGLLGLGHALPQGLRGQDLSEALRRADPGAARPHLVAFDQIDAGRHARVAMVRTPRHKLVVHADPRRYPDAPDELYDLDEDPHEARSLGRDARHAALRAELRAILDAELASLAPPRFPIVRVKGVGGDDD